ncbi:MAG: hypothetical protein KC609_08835 [Myxococcales bacterium]|nr:hypothetical protein [Myxococcales bacterium]
MRVLLLAGVALALLLGAGCKNKYEQACHKGIKLAAQKEAVPDDKRKKADALCHDGVKIYLRALDCIADAGKLADLKTCTENAAKEGKELSQKLK